jgi:hypothetical protein
MTDVDLRMTSDWQAPMIGIRDPTEDPESSRSKFFGAATMRHVPGFELVILRMPHRTTDSLQAVTSPDGTATPSGMATPRRSGS